jgi:Protein of unknown function (DUF2752)
VVDERDVVTGEDLKKTRPNVYLDRSSRAPLIGALLLVYLVIAVISVRQEWPVLCPFRRITGRRCPLCGLSTALSSAAAGDRAGARRAHPLGALAGLLPRPDCISLQQQSRTDERSL